MKKICLIIFSLILILPSVVFASEVNINSLGLSIDIPDGYIVATRDNYDVDLSNSEFVSKYRLYQYMVDNNMYLYTLGNSNFTFYIRAISNPGIENYNSKSDLINDVIQLSKKTGADTYKYIELKDFKLIRFLYTDSNAKKPVLEYYLSWNDVYYTFTIVASGDSISNDDQKVFDDMILSLKLTGDGKVSASNISEDEMDKLKDNDSSNLNMIVIICIILIIIAVIIRKRLDKK